jgi:hypothetical protein
MATTHGHRAVCWFPCIMKETAIKDVKSAIPGECNFGPLSGPDLVPGAASAMPLGHMTLFFSEVGNRSLSSDLALFARSQPWCAWERVTLSR